MKFCEECGTQVEDGAKFCAGCGTMIAAESSPVPTPPAQEPGDAATVGSVDPAPTAGGPGATSPAPSINISAQSVKEFLEPKLVKAAALSSLVVFAAFFVVLTIASIIGMSFVDLDKVTSVGAFQAGLFVAAALLGSAFLGKVGISTTQDLGIASGTVEISAALLPLGITVAYCVVLWLVHRRTTRSLASDVFVRYAVVSALVSAGLMIIVLLIFGRVNGSFEVENRQGITVTLSDVLFSVHFMVPTLCIALATFVIVAWPVILKKLGETGKLAFADLKGFFVIAMCLGFVLGAIGLVYGLMQSSNPLMGLLGGAVSLLFFLPTFVYTLLVSTVFGSLDWNVAGQFLSSSSTNYQTDFGIPAWLRIGVLIVVALAWLAAVGSQRIRTAENAYWISALVFGVVGFLFGLISMPGMAASGTGSTFGFSGSGSGNVGLAVQVFEGFSTFLLVGALVGCARHPAVIRSVLPYATPVWNAVTPAVGVVEGLWSKIVSFSESVQVGTESKQTQADPDSGSGNHG